MRSLLVLTCLCTIALAGCSGGDGSSTTGGTKTVKLEANNDGTLGYCDANNTCTSLPNPDNCKELTITIDTASGKACQVCTAADGTAGPQNCGAPQVACQVITIPDPDCVVCAWVNGTVIFSSCQPVQPPVCYTTNADGSTAVSGSASGSDGSVSASAGADASPPADANGAAIAPAPGCTICIDATGNRVSQDCPPNCEQVACPAIACGPGYEMVTNPGECCGHCEPIAVCNTVTPQGGVATDASAANIVACPDYALVCPDGQVAVKDPTRCCGFLCKPVTCASATDNACPQYIVDCAPGYVWSTEPPHCCGACVPAECKSTDDCPKGWDCLQPPCACIPDGNGGCNVPDGCVGHCSPPDASAANP